MTDERIKILAEKLVGYSSPQRKTTKYLSRLLTLKRR